MALGVHGLGGEAEHDRPNRPAVDDDRLRLWLIIVGCLVGPGGYSLFRGRRA